MEFIQKYAKIDGDDDLDDQMSDAGGDEVNYWCKIYWRWQTKCSGSEFIRLSSDECHQGFAEGFTQPLNVCRAGQVFWPWKFCAWLCRQSRVWIWQIQRLSKKTEKSAKDLKTFEENSKDSFYNTILFGAFHALLDNKENSEFDQSKTCWSVWTKLLWRAPGEKGNVGTRLKLFKFSNAVPRHQWHIDEQEAFLRVHDLRTKFCYLIKKVPQKKNDVRRDLLASAEEQFNGFNIFWRIAENKQKENYVAVDVVYKPVSRIDQIVNYFTSSMRNAYCTASRLKKVWKSQLQGNAMPATSFLCRKKSRKSPENVQLYARIIYKFENQNI